MSELSTTNSQPARTVEAVTLEIQTLQRQAQQLLLGYAIEIGRRLVEVKAMLPHGQWGTYIKEQVGYSQSTANNLMRIFEEYGTAQQSIFGPEAISQAIGNLSYTKALRLLALPADEREAFVEEHNVEDMSTRELEAAIKERDDALRRAEEDRAEREAAEQAREKIAQDMALANERVAQLSRELEELRSRPVEVAVQHAEEEELEQARREAAADARVRVEALALSSYSNRFHSSALNSSNVRYASSRYSFAFAMFANSSLFFPLKNRIQRMMASSVVSADTAFWGSFLSSRICISNKSV